MTSKTRDNTGGSGGVFTSESASGLVQAALCRVLIYAEQRGMVQQETFSFQQFVL